MVQLASAPALLVVDMQNGFCHKQGTFAKMGMQCEPTVIVPHINQLRSASRAANIPIFFLRAGFNADYSDFRGGGDDKNPLQKMRGFIRGSWDADILDELTPEPDEPVFDKTRNSAFFGTSLEKTLKERGINHLILTGVGTDVCVETTARDAFQMDFDVTTISDATGSTNEPDHLAALHALRRFGGTASTAEVIEALRKR